MRRVAIPALALLGACTVGPHYARPDLAPPTSYAEAHRPGTPIELAQWWSVFHDPTLDTLIARGMGGNLDLATAASRIRQARLDIHVARAKQLPTLNADASYNRTEISKNGGIGGIFGSLGGGGASGGTGGSGGGGGAAGALGNIPGFNSYTLGVDANWELDIFGGARRGVEAARASAEAAVWDSRDTAVSLSAEIASDYLDLRLLQRREKIARAELAREQATLRILSARARAGLGPQVDVDRQQAQIAAAQATLDPFIANARVDAHAIAVLIGAPPETLVQQLAAPPPEVAATPLPEIPPGLPADLLRRRPDVRAAERRLASATANIGVAVADLYPKITLTGMAELVSSALRNLFTPNSFMGSFTSALNFPLIDFGMRRATVGLRREDNEQAYITYQQTVLVALRDTEDALARIDGERRRAVFLGQGVAASTRSVSAIRAQYVVGVTDLTSVLDAQQALFQAEDNQAQSDGALAKDTVALYKALGGGWEAAPATVPMRTAAS